MYHCFKKEKKKTATDLTAENHSHLSYLTDFVGHQFGQS